MDSKLVIFGRGRNAIIAPRQIMEVAVKPADLERGLMHRDSLPHGTGMIFLFDKKARWPFWMKDVQFPIDLAWLNAGDGTILETRTMQPGVEIMHLPAYDVDAAIEMPGGFFARYGIKIGDYVLSV